MTRTALLWVVLLALAAAPAAAEDEPTLEEVVALLDSDVPRERAWGAWHVGEMGLRDLELHLWRNLLPDPVRDPHCLGSLADHWTLDALVRLGAKVPWEILLPHALRHRDSAHQALVLLAREAEKNQDALMAVFANRHGALWRVAGNLLVPRKPKGLAAQLLPDFTGLHLHVFVHDREGRMMGMDEGPTPTTARRCRSSDATVPRFLRCPTTSSSSSRGRTAPFSHRAGFAPTVEIVVTDQRENRSEPLPALD